MEEKTVEFLTILYVIEHQDEKTGEMILLIDEVEKKYKELCEFILKTRKSGEITIKINASLVSPDPECNDILVTAEVSKKIQKIKSRLYLKQNESGALYLDNPEIRNHNAAFKNAVEADGSGELQQAFDEMLEGK